MDAILPLEQEHPELAEHIRLIANGEHPAVVSFSASWRRREYRLKDGRRVASNTKPPGRNDNCPCGSGVKYKKCCGR
jgi:uncharacterized protein YchJ